MCEGATVAAVDWAAREVLDHTGVVAEGCAVTTTTLLPDATAARLAATGEPSGLIMQKTGARGVDTCGPLVDNPSDIEPPLTAMLSCSSAANCVRGEFDPEMTSDDDMDDDDMEVDDEPCSEVNTAAERPTPVGLRRRVCVASY